MLGGMFAGHDQSGRLKKYEVNMKTLPLDVSS